jgi:STE24 endopeptidase
MSDATSHFQTLFIIVLVVNIALQRWLGKRHLKHVEGHRETVPESFVDKIPLADHQKAADYTTVRTRVGRVDGLIHAGLLLFWTIGGGLNWLDEFWRAMEWGQLTTGIAFMVSAFFIFGLLDLPMSLYNTFVIEQRFGFNKTTLATYVSDLLKQSVLIFCLAMPLLAAVLWLMESSGPLWWLYAWAVWMGFSLFLMWLYPVAIAPLFNKFSPLEDEALRTRIGSLLARNGLNMQGIFVMDGSRRSGHGNAYFTGFGANKRIVFYDTLLEGLEPHEIEAVLAHEVGHFRAKHIAKQIGLRGVLSLLGLALLGWLMHQAWFFAGLGLAQPSLAGALLLFLLVVPTFTFFLTPVLAAVSRKHEFEADAFAAEQSDASALVTALVKLYKDNASTLTPDPLYSAFHDSHPPAPVRIAQLTSLDE